MSRRRPMPIHVSHTFPFPHASAIPTHSTLRPCRFHTRQDQRTGRRRRATQSSLRPCTMDISSSCYHVKHGKVPGLTPAETSDRLTRINTPTRPTQIPRDCDGGPASATTRRRRRHRVGVGGLVMVRFEDRTDGSPKGGLCVSTAARLKASPLQAGS